MKINRKIWKDEDELHRYMKIYVNTPKMKYKNCDIDMGISKWSSLASIYSSNRDRFFPLINEEYRGEINNINHHPKIKFLKNGKIIHKLYVKSGVWKSKRIEFFKKCANKCECCNLQFQSKELNLHHHTYERLGQELDSDLGVVCINCHHKIHYDNGKKVPLDEETLRYRYELTKTKF